MGNISSRPEISGDISHDVADTSSSNPIKIGFISKSLKTNPGSVSSGNRASAICDQFGIQFVSNSHPWAFNTITTFSGATTGSLLINSPGSTASGLQIHITDIDIYNPTTTVNPLKISLFGATTTNLIWSGQVGGTDHLGRSFVTDLDGGVGNTVIVTCNTSASIYLAGHYSF